MSLINKLHYYFHRVENGFDPVPYEYAKSYFSRPKESADFIASEIDKVEQACRGLAGKNILDLGAGPGHFTKEFSLRAASVTWQDISKNYLNLFVEKYGNIPNIKIQQGYLEESSGLFDIVFSRVCFYYSINDKALARHILNLLVPGGYGYLILDNEGQYPEKSNVREKVKTYLNNATGIKIGHPMMNNKRIKAVFSSLEASYISFDINKKETIVIIRK